MLVLIRSLNKSILKTLAFLSVAAPLSIFALYVFASLPAAETEKIRALSPHIDVHAHLDQTDAKGSVEAALRSMSVGNAAKIIFPPSPFTPGDPAKFDTELILEAEKRYGDKFAFLGGGGTLNAMIQQLVRTGDAGPEVLVLNQLPADLRRKIGTENAMRIYRLKSGSSFVPAPGNNGS